MQTMSQKPRPKIVAPIIGIEASLGQWLCLRCRHVNRNAGPRECQKCARDRYDTGHNPPRVHRIDYDTAPSRKLAIWMNPVGKWYSDEYSTATTYCKRLLHTSEDPMPMSPVVLPNTRSRPFDDKGYDNPINATRAASINNMIHGDTVIPPCFDAEAVASNGALSTELAAPCNLINRIHPIFDEAKWNNTSPEVYDFLRPALRLASRLLFARSLSQYWVTLFEGPREGNTITEDPAVTPEAWRRAQRRLLYYATQTKCITYHWGEAGDVLPFGTDGVWAACGHVHHSQVAREYQPEEWKSPKDPGMRLWHTPIVLSERFSLALSELANIRYHEENSRLRFNFFFATVMLHEIAHAVAYLDACHPARGPLALGLEEPCFLAQTEAECGDAYQTYLFGWDVVPINSRIDCYHGLCCAPTPKPESIPWHALPMVWVHRLQQESSWPDDDVFSTDFAQRRRLNLTDCPTTSKTVWLTTLSRSQQRCAEL